MNDASLVFDAYRNYNRIASVVRDEHCYEQIGKRVQIAARCRENVLLYGESGSGKTFMAKQIHSLSDCSTRKMIVKSVAEFPPALIESQLFGTEPGAFTDAVRHKGCFEQAEGSTLLLDEISELPLELQSKLLSVLEDRYVTRLGSNEKHPVNTRFIFASNKDLRILVKSGLFREDLYYRISVFKIYVPPLRFHMKDVGGLAAKFASERNLIISESAVNKLNHYHWPGNIRELRNVIITSAACVVSRGGFVIQAKDIKIPQQFSK